MPLQLPMTNDQLPQRSARAFTLIEIMVVVAIIIILMAILLPAVTAAKRSAKIAETKSLLASLVTDIEGYYTNFNAYPGPAGPALTSATGTKALSGSQNLLLGLSYAIRTTGDAAPNVVLGPVPPAVQIGTTGLYANPTLPNGPIDRGSQTPAGGFRTYSPFYSPAAKELSPPINPTVSPVTWNPSGISVQPAVTTMAFPAILDRFADPLPILYYRKTPGVDGSATFDGTGNITAAQGTPPIVAADTATNASYYLEDNIEYTAATAILSPSGVAFDQTVPAANPNPNHVFPLNGVAGPNNLATEIAANNNNNATSHGGYVLISAGPDRLYGGGNKSDDVIQVGGQ